MSSINAAGSADREVAEGLRQLTPRPRPESYLAGGVGAFGLLAAAAGYATGMEEPLGLAVGAGSLVVAGLSGAAGYRARQRQEITDHLAEVLGPLLGLRKASRQSVRLTRWQGGFVGTPERIRLHHAAHLPPDPVWRAKVTDTVSQIIGRRFTVASHNARRHVLTLVPEPPEKGESRSVEHAHAERVVKDLLGDSAQTQIECAEDGKVHRIRVKHELGNTMAIAPRRTRTQRILSTRIPGDWAAQWDLQNDEVLFTIRPEMPTLVRPPEEHSPLAVDHRAYMDFAIPYGVDEEGNTMQWCPRKQSHMLVIGGTGSGKTVFQHNVLQRLTQAGWRTWIVDGKRIEFIGFRCWPNVELLGARVEHQVRMVLAAHELMEQRYAKIEAGQATLADFEPLALVIDEATTFLKRVDRWWKTVRPKGSPTKAPVLELLADMARLARSAKIHMLVGLQRPDVEFIGGEMRDNFGARVSMGRLSPQGAMMMWDSPATGTTTPRSVKGRGIGLTPEGQPVNVQFYLAPNPDPGVPEHDPAATAAVRPRELLYSRKLIEILEPDTEDLDGNPVPTGYQDYISAQIYEAEEQPILTRATPLSPAIESGHALAALRAATGSTPQPGPAAGSGERQDPTVDIIMVPTEATTEPEPPAAADDSPATEPEPTAGSTAEDFEGYGPMIELPVADLIEGDLLLVDPDHNQWGVVQDAPEEDDTGSHYVEYLDWQTGEPEALSLDPSLAATVRRANLS